MGARGWGIAMVAALVAGIVLTCVASITGGTRLAAVAFAPYLISFACCVRMLDHVVSPQRPRRFLRGWLHD